VICAKQLVVSSPALTTATKSKKAARWLMVPAMSRKRKTVLIYNFIVNMQQRF
jgi:hypothetical protein